MIDHHFCLSLDNIIFTSNFVFKSFILSIQSLPHNFQRRSTSSLSVLPLSHSGSFLKVNAFCREHLLLLIEQTLWLIRLIKQFLKSGVSSLSIFLPSILNFNTVSFPHLIHQFFSIFDYFLLLLSRRDWLG